MIFASKSKFFFDQNLDFVLGPATTARAQARAKAAVNALHPPADRLPARLLVSPLPVLAHALVKKVSTPLAAIVPAPRAVMKIVAVVVTASMSASKAAASPFG